MVILMVGKSSTSVGSRSRILRVYRGEKKERGEERFGFGFGFKFGILARLQRAPCLSIFGSKVKVSFLFVKLLRIGNRVILSYLFSPARKQ